MVRTDTGGKVELRTSRLILREARTTDLEALHEIFSNEDVMRYWSTPPHKNPSQTKEYLDSMIASPTNGTLEFVLVLPAASPTLDSPTSGIVIGKAGIWSATQLEIGFMLNRGYWGKGYMSETLEILIPHFWAQGLAKVNADVDPRNEASLAVLERFGFVNVGYEERSIETHLGWCDSVYLELKRPDDGVEGVDMGRTEGG